MSHILRDDMSHQGILWDSFMDGVTSYSLVFGREDNDALRPLTQEDSNHAFLQDYINISMDIYKMANEANERVSNFLSQKIREGKSSCAVPLDCLEIAGEAGRQATFVARSSKQLLEMAKDLATHTKRAKDTE